MNKKFLVSFVTIALIVVSGASIIALRQRGQKPVGMIPRAETSDNTQTLQTQPLQQKKATALKEYSDPSGFRFLYPSTLNIVVENTEDPNVYASLKLKTSLAADYIAVKVLNTNFTKLDDWLKANKISPASATIKRTKLADIDAYQVPIQNQLVTAAYDEGALITVLATMPNNPTSREAYDKIISSFAFYEPPTVEEEPAVQDSPSEEVLSDEEEIIE